MKTLNLDYEPNSAYYGDCADIMTAWKEKGVQGIIDLIYLDPPFNSNRNYGASTSKSKESDTGSMDAFTDMWTYDQQAYERTERICKTTAHPACELINGLRGYLEKRDDGMLAYLTYMADRLWLLHGLLKETGSIYLHCDPYAAHYLRILMDDIFGQKCFRNELIWHYFKPHSSKSIWPRNFDILLHYGKSKQDAKTQADPLLKTKFNHEATLFEYDKKSVRRYDKVDEQGKRYKIYTDKKGVVRTAYMKDGVSEGVLKIPFIQGTSLEREGYPTQKPMALLDRIIKASSNEGDVVLDPFCGCGTALHSAFNNNRRFIGIDISVFSIYSVTRKRLKSKCGIDVPIFGIPTNIDGARLLAKQDWESFESWAAESLNFGDIGILSNKIKRCDGGIDGKGKLYGKTDDGEDEVIVQVKGKQGDTRPSYKEAVERFAHTIRSNKKVAAGIFITLDESDWIAGMQKVADSLGRFSMPDGTKSFPRMQHWPVSDRFKSEDGVYPKMPITVNPLNGKPLVNIGHTV